MDIHLAVRDVVGQIGPAVLRDPEQFRAVLDDVLDEDVADVGQVNLLVDAVRFGTVEQLVRMLDSGADVSRAVDTAGAGFARLRGGADPRAASWACAVLGFAIGRVPEDVVLARTMRPAAPPVPTTPHPPPVSATPPPPPEPTRVLIQPPAAPPPTALSYPEPRGGGSTGRIVAIVGLVIAIVAAGYLGWRFFWPRGGAGSPEEAVEQLMLAAADQDLFGVVDMLSPAEVGGLDDVYDALRERAEEEDLVDDDGITDAVDLEFSGLEFAVDELGDDLARVTLTSGEYDASWDPSELPERLDFVAEETAQNSESGDIDALFDGEEPTVTTVEIDGRWYVTLVGTAADYAYEEAEDEAAASGVDLDEPDYDLASDEADPVTSDEPQDVIGNLADAINAEDVGRLLANLPEDLVKPLRPYIPVVEGALADDGWSDGEPGIDVGAENLDLDTEELDDGKVKVVIRQGSFTGTLLEDGDVVDSGSIEVRGDCVGYYPAFDEAEADCISDAEVAADLGLGEIFFVVQEVDDGYQLDPAATLLEYADAVVDGLTSDVVEEILADLENEL